ncbi:MAG: sugar transferase [Gemmatimonadales bacterium]
MTAKRALDVVGSALGLVLLSPALVLIAVLIRREDGGPVFYRPLRVGQGGRSFRLWKFRTMVVDADRIGAGLTVGDDPRITRIGRALRGHKLDELPQLIDVLLGEMSLVGPRPEAPEYVALYTEDQRKVLDLIPGITDPASIKYANESQLLALADDPQELYVTEIMPEKILINLDYARAATVLSDIGVVVRTLARIWRS